MKYRLFFSIAFALGSMCLPAAEPEFLPGVKRVVFLGDSITHGGHYVECVEAYALTRFPDRHIEFLNLGLPSETVSGLSEPGHAGGQFPRPDLHERLDRVLAQTKPDLVIACYGMNDGIYYPFGEERFKAFQAGIQRLREKAVAAGARIIHLTPPTFDPVPLKGKTLPAGLDEYRSPFEGYDTVLDRYSDWLIAQRAQGWDVVDIHGPMNRYLADQRKENPGFRLANDGVHASDVGHWLMAQQLLLHWGAPPEIKTMTNAASMVSSLTNASRFLQLVAQRQHLLRDSWLNTVGHKRPGMSKGLPLPEAEARAAEIETELRKLALAR